MKKVITSILFLGVSLCAFSQIDTISRDFYQLNNNFGMGKVNYGGYFNSKLLLYNGWLQVSDSSDIHDAGIVVSHLNRTGYGFARTLHMVYEGVIGDPYTEFRIRDSADKKTITSWAIGADNSDKDKLVISNILGTTTGASPSVGNRLFCFTTNGNLGLGINEPKAKLDIDGAIKIGNSTDSLSGTIRWTGSDFEGFNGNSWMSLTSTSNNSWKQNNNNIFYDQGNVGIGKINNGGYFHPRLLVSDGWLQVTDSSNTQDAGIVISHLNKTGYGFARTLHMVYEGVNGDPYTEFRIRNSADNGTVTSWSLGADNSDNDKLIISNSLGTSTGASPSVGDKMVAIKTTGEFGIGTSDPKSKLQVANGDIYISDINKGIIMKSPDNQCWRGTLNNDGNLIFTPIACPEGGITENQKVDANEPNSITIFPNPSEDKLYIGITGFDSSLNLNIYSLEGKQLKTILLKSEFSNIDLANFSVGSYILNFTDKNGKIVKSEKFIKK